MRVPVVETPAAAIAELGRFVSVISKTPTKLQEVG